MVLSQEPIIHYVSKGETLSEIVERYFTVKIYGKDGNLKKIVNSNNIKTPNRIYPGMAIIIKENEIILSDRKPVSEVVVEEKKPVEVVVIEETESSSDEEATHIVYGGAGFAFTTIKAEDKTTKDTAKIFSSSNVSALLGWKQIWSSKFSSFAEFQNTNVSFQAPTNTLKTINGRNARIYQLNIGGEYSFTDRLRFVATTGYGQRFFVHGTTSNIIEIKSVPLMNVGGGLRWDFLKKGSTVLGSRADIYYLSSASTDTFSVKAGQLIGAGLYVEKNWNEKKLSLDVGMNHRKQDTSELTQTEDNVGFLLKFHIPLD